MTGFEALQQLRLPDAWQAEAIRALAAAGDAPLPLFSVAEALFRRAVEDGRAHQDIGCVIELLDARGSGEERTAGAPLDRKATS